MKFVKLYVSDAFSTSMLNFPDRDIRSIYFKKMSVEEARETIEHAVEVEGIIGYDNTAQIVNEILDIPITHTRKSVKIYSYEEAVLVCQYSGPRLPEGTTVLPEGAKIEFILAY